jgi:hypothetical protein
MFLSYLTNHWLARVTQSGNKWTSTSLLPSLVKATALRKISKLGLLAFGGIQHLDSCGYSYETFTPAIEIYRYMHTFCKNQIFDNNNIRHLPGYDPRPIYIGYVMEKTALLQVFLPVLRCLPVSIIPPTFRTHLLTHIALTITTNRRKLKTFPQNSAVLEIAQHWREKYFHFLYASNRKPGFDPRPVNVRSGVKWHQDTFFRKYFNAPPPPFSFHKCSILITSILLTTRQASEALNTKVRSHFFFAPMLLGGIICNPWCNPIAATHIRLQTSECIAPTKTPPTCININFLGIQHSDLITVIKYINVIHTYMSINKRRNGNHHSPHHSHITHV